MTNKKVSAGLKKNQSGMSLLEILVVIGIFSILGIIVARSVLLTLRGSRKSESTLRVRENLDYSLGVIERQLRNADSVSPCPNPDTSQVDYIDAFGVSANFSCESIGTNGYIASSSARLTNQEIEVTQCSFVCTNADTSNPPSVDITLVGQDANATGIESATVTTSTKIFLRTY